MATNLMLPARPDEYRYREGSTERSLIFLLSEIIIQLQLKIDRERERGGGKEGEKDWREEEEPIGGKRDDVWE